MSTKFPKAYRAKDHSGKDFPALPAGEYTGECVATEVKANSKGTGTICVMQFKIVKDEEHNGRLLFHNLNIDNPNPNAVAISDKHLKQMCVAIGEPDLVVDDSAIFMGKFFKMKVTIRPEQGGYDESNNINKFLPAGGKGKTSFNDKKDKKGKKGKGKKKEPWA